MSPKGINKFHRFIFLNFYAILLLFLGIGIGVIPLYKTHWCWLALQIILVAVFLTSSMRIFSTWEHKKRDYSLLIRKNQEGIRPTSFSDYMQAPCGRLLVILVLRDLGQQHMYKELKMLQKPFRERLKEGCTGQQTVVTVYKRDSDQNL